MINMLAVADITTFTQSTALLWLVIVASLLILGGLLIAYRSIRETTLIAPWCWAVVAVVVFGGETMLTQFYFRQDPDWAFVSRFTVAVLTFCPMMAVLGAKRPQNLAWQFIVLSLWVVLLLPSGHALLFRKGQLLELHGVQSWFLFVLISVGLINYLPTRYFLPAILYATAQYCLLSPYLPIWQTDFGQYASLYAGSFFFASLLFVHLVRFQKPQATTRLDQLWIDFRNLYGVIWAVRIQQQVNLVSQLQAWPVYLTWNGFEKKPEQENTEAAEAIDEQTQKAIEKSFRTLLRRFVSRDWISRRLNMK